MFSSLLAHLLCTCLCSRSNHRLSHRPGSGVQVYEDTAHKGMMMHVYHTTYEGEPHIQIIEATNPDEHDRDTTYQVLPLSLLVLRLLAEFVVCRVSCSAVWCADRLQLRRCWPMVPHSLPHRSEHATCCSLDRPTCGQNFVPPVGTEAHAMFLSLDKDGDGVITEEELAAGVAARVELATGAALQQSATAAAAVGQSAAVAAAAAAAGLVPAGPPPVVSPGALTELLAGQQRMLGDLAAAQASMATEMRALRESMDQLQQAGPRLLEGS